MRKAGWRSPNIKKTPIADHQCIYQFLGRRCPLIATKTASLYGNSVWYCFEHFQHLNNSKRSIEILLEAEKNFEAIMEARIDWRRKLYPEDYQAMKSHINKLFRSIIKN